ncbi:hypothetical protein AX16_003938 [Volvariella volvacea WC 439]|nr:hypothetical protein AX16_003938 [Volvariella volvacea WC 439]
MVSAGLLSDFMWDRFISEWGAGWSIQASLSGPLLTGLNGIVACIVQVVFARRIWVLSQSMKGGIIASVVVLFIKLGRNPMQADLLATVAKIAVVAAVACDLTFTVTIAILLWKARLSTRLQQTTTLLNKLILSTVETGAMTSIAAILQGFVFLYFPKTSFYTIFLYVLGRLYATALLASLNRRSCEIARKRDLSCPLELPSSNQTESKESEQSRFKGMNLSPSPSSPKSPALI